MQKTALLIFFGIIIFPWYVSAQLPTPWFQSYGGDEWDFLRSTISTADGGFLAVGFSQGTGIDVSENYGLKDVWVLKLNSDGEKEWEQNYGGSGEDEGVSVVELSNGDFLVAAFSDSEDGDRLTPLGSFDFWIFRIDPTGNLLWEKSYGGSNSDKAKTVVLGPGNKISVLGTTQSVGGDVGSIYGNEDMWLIQIDDSGNFINGETFGGTGEDVSSDLLITPEGDYLITGTSNSQNHDSPGTNGAFDMLTLKIDSSLSVIWSETYGGSLGDQARSLAVATGSGYYLGGISQSNDFDVLLNYGNWDYWVTKLDYNGNVIWSNNYGGTGIDYLEDIEPVSGGGFVMTGSSGSVDGEVLDQMGYYDIWTVKVDSTGVIEWAENQGTTGHDFGANILVIGIDEYLVSGVIETIESQYQYYFERMGACEVQASWVQTICSSDSIEFFGNFYHVEGTYWDTLIAWNGCDSVGTLALSVIESPIQPEINEIHFDTLALTTTYDSVSWFLDENPLVSSLENSIFVNETGSYTAIGWSNGCGSPISDPFSFVYVDLEEIMGGFPAVIYFRDRQLTLEFKNDLGPGTELNILDLTGRTIFSCALDSGEKVFMPGHSSLNPGVYFISVSVENKILVSKKLILVE